MSNLCKNCKFAKRDLILGWNFAKCHHPNNFTFNLVTGGYRLNDSYCSTQRIFSLNTCGHEGKWFEQKEPSLFEKLINKYYENK